MLSTAVAGPVDHGPSWHTRGESAKDGPGRRYTSVRPFPAPSAREVDSCRSTNIAATSAGTSSRCPSACPTTRSPSARSAAGSRDEDARSRPRSTSRAPASTTPTTAASGAAPAMTVGRLGVGRRLVERLLGRRVQGRREAGQDELRHVGRQDGGAGQGLSAVARGIPRKPARRVLLHPARVIVVGFAAAIADRAPRCSAIGAATEAAGRAPFETALFTAVSAVTVTGLASVNTATYWSPFGQAVILGLVQLGGLGHRDERLAAVRRRSAAASGCAGGSPPRPRPTRPTWAACGG